MSSGSIGDVNNDGHPDFVAGMTRRMFMVALGSATGEFTTAPGSPFLVPPSIVNPSGSFTTAAIGDYDGDGNADVALGLDDNTNSLPAVFTAKGDGTGAFTSTGTPAQQFGAYQWPTSLATIDLDGDEYDDLAVVSPNAAAAITLVGSATGLVSNPAPNGTVSLAGNYPYAGVVTDLDNDGHQDLAVANRGGDRSVSTLISSGDGNLTQSPNSPFLLPPIDGKSFAANTIMTGDFNGDGAPDIASTSTHGGDPNQARGIDVLISQMQSEVSPSSLEFPVTPVDETSDPMVVTIKNTGAPTFSLNLVEKTGASANNFNVDLDGCPSSIVAGDECEVAVTFDPAGTQGTFDATLVLTYAGGAGQASIPMTGRTPAYMDFVPPNGLEFDETISGYAPDEKTETVVIYSGGGVPLELGAPQLVGPDTADFRIENPNACADPIDFGDHCALDITFAPQANTGGLREANLTFASNNDPTFDELIPLSGYARRAEFTVSPASFDFGEAKISPTIQRTPQTFTLTSTGPAKVPFSGVQMTGPNADSFLITDNTCPAMIPANDGTCSISVVFDPKFGSASAVAPPLRWMRSAASPRARPWCSCPAPPPPTCRR